MKKIKEIVVVEGKTDTALLKELFEVDTIETHGLALDQQTLELIQEASKSRGIIKESRWNQWVWKNLQ